MNDSGTYAKQDIKYRPGKTSLVPYVELVFPEPIIEFIDHVYIGPTPQMELSKRALQGFLGDSIELIESKVPYLG